MPSLGQTPGLIIAAGVGAAASVALQPAFEVPKQDAWARLPHRILDTGVLARLVAQGGVPLGQRDGSTDGSAYAEARRDGFTADKLDALVYLSQQVPGIGEALRIWRRNWKKPFEVADFAELWTHSLVKQGFDARYLPFLNELVEDRISAQVVALAIVRGIMPDPGFLPVGPPTGSGKVKPFPVSTLDSLAEGRAGGFDKERLRILTAIQGRPMGPEGAAAAVFRQILDRVDYDRAIAEGDVRNEWADAIFEAQRQIPSPSNYVEHHLRGWSDEDAMHAGAARHGMKPEDVDVLYQIAGRPATGHQVLIGLRRGGKRNGPTTGIPDDFATSIKQSNIRPEWTNVLWKGAETYPSGFMIRGAIQNGDLTPEQGRQLLYEMGWPEKWIPIFVASWAPQAAGAAGAKETAANLRAEYEGYLLSEAELRSALQALGYAPAEVDREVHLGDAARVKAYRDKALEAAHKSYITAQITSASATDYLGQLRIDAAAIAELLAVWEIEKAVTRKTLTAAQIRAAYRRGTITQAEAIADLEEHGYSAADASTYLAS